MRALIVSFAAGLALHGSVGLLAPAVTRAEPATYGFDRQHTSITVSWNHLGLSRQSTRVLDFDGTLEFDPAAADAAKVEVVMKTASLASGVPELDRALKSPDFFDAGRHPQITFRSTGVKKSGDKTGEVTGDLTIMGITRPVTLEVTLNFAGEHPWSTLNALYRDKFVAGFSARGRLSRSEFGLKRGAPLVSDEIEVTIETELIRK